jgi:bifunctional non-homologous end joining protein LigD
VEHVRSEQEYIVCNNLPTLLWLAQIADLEIHTWQSRIAPGPDGTGYPRDFGSSLEALEKSLLNYPDYLLFDLDPYIYSGKEKSGDEPELNIAGFRQCAELAKWLKDIFDTIGIEAFIKTTGKTGLHIYIPIVRDFTFDEVRALSDAIGRIVLKQHPNDVTMDWAVVKRKGKTFLDHNMNARGKTLASIYSPRVSPEAAVSVPVRWDQLDDIYPTDFTMRTVPDLLAKQGDLWGDILDHKNDLRKLLDKTGMTPQAPPKKRRKSS